MTRVLSSTPSRTPARRPVRSPVTAQLHRRPLDRLSVGPREVNVAGGGRAEWMVRVEAAGRADIEIGHDRLSGFHVLDDRDVAKPVRPDGNRSLGRRLIDVALADTAEPAARVTEMREKTCLDARLGKPPGDVGGAVAVLIAPLVETLAEPEVGAAGDAVRFVGAINTTVVIGVQVPVIKVVLRVARIRAGPPPVLPNSHGASAHGYPAGFDGGGVTFGGGALVQTTFPVSVTRSIRPLSWTCSEVAPDPSVPVAQTGPPAFR